MAQALDFSPQLVEEAPARIRQACDLIEAELRRSGGPFVGGEEPNAIDIVFSALLAPVVVPPGYGAKLPPLEALPAELRLFAEEMRGRRAGALVRDTYKVARGTPQPPLPARGSGRP